MTNVKKTYKTGVTAIQNLNLTISKGDFVFIIGSTGCGKSTLIKMLYREEKPTSGQIIVGGIDVGKLRNGKVYKIRRKIGVVFQDFKLLPKSTVYENVAFALEIFGLPKEEIHAKVLKVLELVGDYKLIEFKPAVPFQTVGFLAKIAEIIANQGMNILIVSTFSKDYIMIKEEFCEKGLKALKSAGFPIEYE